MINPVEHLPSTGQITQAGARYFDKVGSAFYTVLGRLYAAHTEKALMRLAPTREIRFRHVNAGCPWPAPGDFQNTVH